MVDNPSRPLKFTEFKSSIIEMPVGASEVFKHLGGCYVVPDGSGRIEIAGATDVNIIGWAHTYDYTASTTEGRTVVGVEVDLFKLFKMPAIDGSDVGAVTEAELIAAIGECCDIYVASNIQYCDVLQSSYDILHIYGYEYHGSAAGLQTAIVNVNVENIVSTDIDA